MNKRVLPTQVDILIIGAGPVGLFTVFEAGILELECHLIDSLGRPGGQCIELYPEKPIYDIPGVPSQTAREHVEALIKQADPFNPTFHLAQTVTKLITTTNKDKEKEFHVSTSAGKRFITKNIIIAGGAGNFHPKKPIVKGLEKFEGRGLEYAVRDKEKYANKRVLIFGGGDSALDWTVELAQKAKEVTLIHRTANYRAAPHTIKQARALSNVKEVTGILERLENNKRYLDYAVVKTDGDPIIVPCDEVLIFYGLKTDLTFLKNWGLELDADERKIPVDTEKFQSNVPGIFVVGDMCTYPGKLPLILCGFHETTLAVQECFHRARPGEKLRFLYTTTSPKLRKKLDNVH
jgi:thioredoxin reductase (NADPH)